MRACNLHDPYRTFGVSCIVRSGCGLALGVNRLHRVNWDPRTGEPKKERGRRDGYRQPIWMHASLRHAQLHVGAGIGHGAAANRYRQAPASQSRGAHTPVEQATAT